MKRVFIAIALALSLGACSTLQTFTQVATATVPANVVVPAANAFDILKAGATNYGKYCIANKMTPAICSADARRVVVKAVRAGTGARNQLEASLASGQPAASSVYNVLVAAVTSLQASPAAAANFTGASQ